MKQDAIFDTALQRNTHSFAVKCSSALHFAYIAVEVQTESLIHAPTFSRIAKSLLAIRESVSACNGYCHLQIRCQTSLHSRSAVLDCSLGSLQAFDMPNSKISTSFPESTQAQHPKPTSRLHSSKSPCNCQALSS